MFKNTLKVVIVLPLLSSISSASTNSINSLSTNSSSKTIEMQNIIYNKKQAVPYKNINTSEKLNKISIKLCYAPIEKWNRYEKYYSFENDSLAYNKGYSVSELPDKEQQQILSVCLRDYTTWKQKYSNEYSFVIDQLGYDKDYQCSDSNGLDCCDLSKNINNIK